MNPIKVATIGILAVGFVLVPLTTVPELLASKKGAYHGLERDEWTAIGNWAMFTYEKFVIVFTVLLFGYWVIA